MNSNKYYILPDVRIQSDLIKESGSKFLCPNNTVLTGRWHKGDENGKTQYEYATLKVIDSDGNLISCNVTIEDIQWSLRFKESSNSGYDSPNGRVIVGRVHDGDENGQTQYATAIIKIDGQSASIENVYSTSQIKESSGVWSISSVNSVMVGRHHSGDENGKTYYKYAEVVYYPNSSEDAPNGTTIIPSLRYQTTEVKESSHVFLCPENTVLTGRSHVGDENGDTQYEYATLKALDNLGRTIIGRITVEDVIWEEFPNVDDNNFNESSGFGFDAKIDRVIVGRRHYGDENGKTEYATGVVKFNGHITHMENYDISEARIESGGWNWFVCPDRTVVTGRHHQGDENGYTYYCYGQIFTGARVTESHPIEIIVALHSAETKYPMNPTDFIKLSRFRKNNEGGPDEGYNKITHTFEENNQHDPCYFNIPVSIINNYYVKDAGHMLKNKRPLDYNLYQDSYFLQPFDNLCGDTYPNNRVSVYSHTTEYTLIDGREAEYIEYWMFYGHDDANKTIDFSHQGDWERVIVRMVDNRIDRVWLSQHTSLAEYTINNDDLKIETVDGKQVLTIYSAIGSHALYPKAGDYDLSFGAKDHTNDLGYKWKITNNIKLLDSQPWKLFSGAWGEVGSYNPITKSDTTGPLGPWYKRFDFYNKKNLRISDLITANQLLIAPTQKYISEFKSESKDSIFVAPSDMILTGRKHMGDENGITVCQYSPLVALDVNGNVIQGTIKIINRRWTEWSKESDSFINVPDNCVITGRQHNGDENGSTRYEIGEVMFNNVKAKVKKADAIYSTESFTESQGVFFETDKYLSIIGRRHSGDENGSTLYTQGVIYVEL